MLIKTQGIILHNVRLGDKKVISKIYTQHYGLQSYAVSFSTSAKSKIRPAHLQPLNQVELEVIAKEKNEINRVTEMRLLHPYADLHANFFKSCIAAFINEMLYKSLRESEENESLYDFISWSLRELDGKKNDFSSYHLYFLVELTQHLGFFPRNNFSNKNFLFNILDGRFEPHAPPHPNYFDREDSEAFARLLEHYGDYQHAGIITQAERARQLNLLINYFRLHLPGFPELKSLPVLQSTLQS